jgi:hypothetical protein
MIPMQTPAPEAFFLSRALRVDEFLHLKAVFSLRFIQARQAGTSGMQARWRQRLH